MMADDKFDQMLIKLMKESSVEHIISIPGVYEAVSEHYNNEVLERLERDTNDRDD